MSSRVRVNTATSVPARWTWTRAPSSFHSTAASPTRSMAASTLVAVEASIGCRGRPTSRWNSRSPGTPEARATSATGPRAPRSIRARRTSAPGTPAALAMASTITPSSAPWRSSPESSPIRNRCSAAVARPNSSATSRRRSACDPGPASRPIRSKAASTPATVRDGSGAGSGASRRAAQPTPIWRCRSSPERKATAGWTSPGSRRRRQAASRSTLARRAELAATAADVSAISSSSTRPLSPGIVVG